MSTNVLTRALIVAAASIGCSAAVVACASRPDPQQVTVIMEPDFNDYVQYVDPYLTRRCGTLDCHGQPGRAYRIYSREGYRLDVNDAGLVSGQQPTTPEEQRANFEALVSVEPEEMSRLMYRQGQDPNRLVILRKPLKLERHKGGPAMALDDPGYRCVTAWLAIPVVDENGPILPAAARQPMSAQAIANCTTAASFP